MSIKAIDKASIHHITSGQVIIDLQTAVKELVENSVDAGATSIEVRFRNYGLSSIEVVDNGCGIAEDDYESIALKHHTSKLATFSDLTSVETFGFRGEALSSLCALSEQVSVSTATASTTPMGTSLVLDSSGKLLKRSAVARNQGTSIILTNIFSPLAVRRKELERNIKREFAKALSLLNAYALGPCATAPGIRLTVTNQQDKGGKSTPIRTLGLPSCRESVTALWGPKSLENIVDVDLTFEVEREKIALKRLQNQELEPFTVQVRGLTSKFSVGCGRAGTDRQFFYVNGRPCNMNKVQKCFNEVYRSFNATQAPFIVANLIIPTQVYDVNVSPDKRTILLHSEANLISALKATLEVHFAPSRATFDLGETQSRSKTLTQSLLPVASSSQVTRKRDSPLPEDNDESPSAASPPLVTTPPLRRLRSTATDGNANCDGDVMEPSSGITMDVDGRARAPTLPTHVMVLGTSQTTWGQRMGLSTQLRRALVSPPPGINDGQGVEEVEHNPRKKRKSEIGATRDRHIASPSPPSSSPLGIAEPGPSARARISIDQMVPATPPAVSLPRGLKDVRVKSASTQSRAVSLRSQLAGFSRSGSQIAARRSSSTNVHVDDGDEESPGEDELEDEEVTPLPLRSKAHTRPAYLSSAGSNNQDVRDQSEGTLRAANIDEDSDSVSYQLRDADTPDAGASRDDDHHVEILKREQSGGDLSLRFDVERTKVIWSRRSTSSKENSMQVDGNETPASITADAGITNTGDGDKAVDALARVIEKKDFAEMNVIGQFNLGFIIVRRGVKKAPKGPDNSDDLFIVDQHAADEKYNFETLQATTKIESQKLFRPRPLELTASDEMLAMENIDILKQNGFEIDVDPENAISEGSRLMLTAQPVSKSTTFDMKDLEEVIHLLRDRPGGQMVRCSKARAMFAMRACRKSVMVGMPLTVSQMTSVIRHMGTMDQPWNCPHGRPTMRHLTDIRSRNSRSKEGVDWSSFQ